MKRMESKITGITQDTPGNIPSNRWLKVVFKLSLITAVLSIPYNIVLWIAAPDKGSKGSILGLTLAIILFFFFGSIIFASVKTTGSKRRLIKLTIGFLCAGFFFFAGLLMQVNITKDLLTGMQVRAGILEYYKDEGRVSSNNSNHDYKIKISTYDEELSVARPVAFGEQLNSYLYKEIYVAFYMHIKQIEDVYFDRPDGFVNE